MEVGRSATSWGCHPSEDTGDRQSRSCKFKKEGKAPIGRTSRLQAKPGSRSCLKTEVCDPACLSRASGRRSRMRTRSQSVPIVRSLVVLAPACLGWLFYCAADWLISHDSIEYWLNDAGFRALTNSAEVAFAIGVVPSIFAGLVLGLPAALGVVLHSRWIRRVAIANAAACLALASGLGLVSSWATPVLLSVSVLLWLLAVILMVVCWAQSVQAGASPDGGHGRPFGNSGATDGPPPVT
jgi:hypothetical protein